MTDNFIQRLPCFDSAPVDELIDIKSELSSPLARFRSKMLTYSSEIQSLPWDNDFESECNLLYDKEVVPALLEIEEATKENTFLKNLSGKLLTDEGAWKSMAGMVVAVAAAGVIPAFNQALSTDATILAAGGAVAIKQIASSYAEYRNVKKMCIRDRTNIISMQLNSILFAIKSIRLIWNWSLCLLAVFVVSLALLV